MVEVGGLQCLGGAQLLSASVSWAPTGDGHSARQPLPSPSHLESTHETRVLGGGWQQEEDGVRKEHLMLPCPRMSLSWRSWIQPLYSTFWLLKMQYWAGSNSFSFHMSLSSIYTDRSGLESALKELRVWGGKYV